jgi:hypothetical protein
MFARHIGTRVACAARAAVFLLLLPALAAFGVSGCGSDDTSKPNDNRSPTIDILTADLPIVATGDTATVTCLAVDADGDSLSYAWSAPSGTLIGSGAAVRWQAPAGDGPHEIRVAVTDGNGGTARDTVSVDVMGGTLLISDRGGLHAVGAYGGEFPLSASGGYIEVLGTRIFRGPGGVVEEIDHDGQPMSSILIPGVDGYNFTMLPDGGFALLSNSDDEVHFVSSDGALIETVPMPEASENLQNVDGVIAGDRLIVSDNGNNGVLAFDLTTREASILHAVDDGLGWLGSIDFHDGTLYLCRSMRVQAFTGTGEPITLCTLPAGNITGIVVVGSYAYAVINFENSLYRIDLRTGEYEQILNDLDYPKDIEYLPVRLEP